MTDELIARLERVKAHADLLRALFEAPSIKEVDQRIWRARFFHDDNFMVATLWQNVNVIPPNPAMQVPSAQVFIHRGFSQMLAGQGPVAQLQLHGQYSFDEIVAFLELDKLDPAQVEWVDETRYSTILTVRDVLRVHRND